MKKISYGNILIVEKEFLIVNAKPGKPNGWDIPKGGANDGEAPLEAARRELYEETNIVLDPDNIISVYDLGVHEYYSSKDLHIIVTFLKEKPVDLKCNAFFIINDLKVPEVHDFKWVTLSDSKNYLFKNLYKTISGVYPT